MKELEIITGLFSGMVAQRKTSAGGDISFNGNCPGVKQGVVYGRLDKGPWQEIGRAEHGTFIANLPDVPAGGPYSIDLQVKSGEQVLPTAEISDVYMGDVWIMAGQSNMVGDGLLADGKQARKGVQCFYMDDTWGKAEEPLHSLQAAVDAVHYRLQGRSGPAGRRQDIDAARKKGAGCGISFANVMNESLKVPIGLIACAHGGTRLAQWLPGYDGEEGDSLYTAMMRRVRKNGGAVAGVIWYQGESDTDYGAAEYYRQRMALLIESLRRDLNNPRLPFIQAQLSCVYYIENRYKDYLWTFIREQQRLLTGDIANTATVSTLDLELGDPIHLATGGLAQVGRRMALTALKCINSGDENKSLCGGPSVSGASFKSDEEGDCVEVTLAGNDGPLQTTGRPQGFYLRGEFGWAPPIYRTVIDNKDNLIRLYFCNDNPTNERFFLYYGYGMAPYCNITDSEGNGLLGFGPYDLGIKPACNVRL